MRILSQQSIEIIKTLTINHLKIKYKRTSLGFFWSLLNPMFSVGVISLVFSIIMGMKYSEFIVIFFPAFLVWNYFANSVNGSAVSLVNNEHLIRKTPINLMIFPLVAVAINFVEFVLVFIAFILILTFINYEPTIHLLYIPISIVLLTILTIGISLIVSVISTFLRDIAYLVGVFMQLWFYLSPVLYSKDFIAGKSWMLDTFMILNPMTYFIEMFRNPISYHRVIDVELLFVSASISFVSIALGLFVFNKNEHKLVHML
jgi:ABC-type polysaccharide/polyol phosphate export permease